MLDSYFRNTSNFSPARIYFTRRISLAEALAGHQLHLGNKALALIALWPRPQKQACNPAAVPFITEIALQGRVPANQSPVTVLSPYLADTTISQLPNSAWISKELTGYMSQSGITAEATPISYHAHDWIYRQRGRHFPGYLEPHHAVIPVNIKIEGLCRTTNTSRENCW